MTTTLSGTIDAAARDAAPLEEGSAHPHSDVATSADLAENLEAISTSTDVSIEDPSRSLGPIVTSLSNKTSHPAVKRAMNRLDKHDLPKRRVAARLRRMGLTVRNVSSANGYDLLVGPDDHRITLRVAFPGLRRHRVTVAGRTYHYRYRTWHFNFHHHGKLKERYTDFFICLGVNPGKSGKWETFVIPWDKVTGKTFSLHGGRGPYSGRYAQYRDAWHLLAAPSHRASFRRVA